MIIDEILFIIWSITIFVSAFPIGYWFARKYYEKEKRKEN